MPRRRMRDYMMGRDMRNPYGSAGGYVVSSRRGRRDRARGRDGLMMEDMRRYNAGEYEYDLAEMTRQDQEVRHDPYMPRDYETGMVNRGDYAGRDYNYDYREYDMARGNRAYSQQDNARGSRDYERGREYDMAYDYADMRGRGGRGRDGHYPMVQGYMPIEAMGRFTGYYGMGGEDYARGRGRRDYRGYDYGYDYTGDYGENLTKEELAHWSKKLMGEMEDKDKQFFAKENIMRKAKEMGIKFDKFNEEEFYVAVLMMYTDYCKTLGSANMDIYLRLAKDWLEDDDVSVKGGEKLAVYHDNIVEEDD